MQLALDNFALLHHFDDFTSIAMAKQLGFDAISYDFYPMPQNTQMFTADFREYAARVRQCLEAHGLRCNQAHAPDGQFGEPWSEEQPAFGAILRAMEAASILGAPYIVIHTIRIPAGEDVSFETYNYGFLKSLEPYSRRFGIQIALENLPDRDKTRQYYIPGFFGAPEAVNAMLRKLDSDRFVFCLDTGHASLAGLEPEDFIAAVDSQYLKLIHIQDTDYKTDSHMLPYVGDFHWEAIMQSLKRIDYAGDFTYEITKYVRKFPAALYPDVLKLAASVGRYLIDIYEQTAP